MLRGSTDLTDSDGVSTILATSNWTPQDKIGVIVAYRSFAKTFDIKWAALGAMVQRKLP